MGRGGTPQTPALCGAVGKVMGISPPRFIRQMMGKHFIALVQRCISCLLAWSMGEGVLTSAPQRPQTSGESLSLVASTGWYLIDTCSPCMMLCIGCKQATWSQLR